MAKLVSSASMIRILKQALHSKIEAYGLFVYIKIELCGSHRIAVYWQNQNKQRSEILFELHLVVSGCTIPWFKTMHL